MRIHQHLSAAFIVAATGVISLFFILNEPTTVQSGHCRDNTKPVTSVRVKEHSMECNGQARPFTNPVPNGCQFRLDATGFWQQGCESDGSGNVQWSESPSGVVERTARGGNIFTPWFRTLQSGTVRIKATLDGVTSNEFVVSIGSGPAPSGTITPTPPPADPPESNTICAYQKDNKPICVPKTENFTAEMCAQNTTCTTNGGCTVVERGHCDDPQPSVSIHPINQPPPQDLGQLIESLFKWSLRVVGIVVFVMAVYGSFLMVLAGGMPSMHARGREVITNAFMGAMLLLAAYVILNTINPDFVSQQGALPPLPTPQAPQ